MSAVIVPSPSVVAGTTRPLYMRSKPVPQDSGHFTYEFFRVDLSNTNVHLPPYLEGPFNLSNFTGRLDARAAAIVHQATGPLDHVQLATLLERTDYGGEVSPLFHARPQCLAALAYADYFPDAPFDFRGIVSEAILAAKPGYAGTFGPVDNTVEALFSNPEGNYDFGQMYLLALAYRHYDDLTPAAREHLIIELLQKAIVRRPGHDDTHTSGAVPADWPEAGRFEVAGIGLRSIGETENHILTILTTRYLCNQLLYQRTHAQVHDNRRNGNNGGPHCTDLVLSLLRSMLRDDFSEYNAKNYQSETRHALLNLCSYAYDHEVRLAARMVLDYVSAHIAVSSSDLRRMVPFRRRNEGKNVTQLPGGFMGVGLLEYQQGADPLTRCFTIQTGNTRAYETMNTNLIPGKTDQARPWVWSLDDNGYEPMLDVLSDYRLPPSIHDLFVNDMHRRFFQRLHRTPRPEEQGGNRNCDNMEIYAGSPSYLITAGGEPATWAIDPRVLGVPLPGQDQQLGVAVTTSFMPTGQSAGEGTQNMAWDLIQFGSFSDQPPKVANYGVAPDFACGHRVHLPHWFTNKAEPPVGKFQFVDMKGRRPGVANGGPGFYLALYKQGEFAVMEAFDTWLHPNLPYEQFKAGVLARNSNLSIESGVLSQYTTQNGNRIHFIIYDEGEDWRAAIVSRVEYGDGDPNDRIGDAGNVTTPFLNGTVLNSPAEAVVEITNPSLGTTIVLDMSDKWRPRRIDENGRVEQAGGNNEVWVDFDWTGPSEGDFYRPFKTLGAAAAAVADGGVIKIVPGASRETPHLGNKRMRIEAPIGGVFVGIP